MALNTTALRARTLTAVLFVVVMLGALLWNLWSFLAIITLIHFGSWLEYQKLMEKINADYKKINVFHRYGIMLAGWCLILYFTNSRLWLGGWRLSEIGFWTGILLMIALPLMIFFASGAVFVKNMAQSVFGLLYISLPLGLLTDIRMTPAEESVWGVDLSLFYVLFLILSLWINDTMAYLLGSLIGKTPLSSISPKKTWEGTIGGVLLCIAVMTLIGWQAGISIRDSIVISALAAVAGSFGDLFESKLKRMAGVKDSGSILPGHGGFLDRFDSLLFAAVLVWFYLALFVRPGQV